MGTQSRKFGSRSRQVIIMMTLSLVPMFEILGLVADVGYMRFIRISLLGTSGFSADYSLLPNASPIQKVMVVE